MSDNIHVNSVFVATPSITPRARRDITDYLRAEGVPWWGQLGEIPFLERIWDLSELPSTDSRFRTAEGDIYQHRVRNPEDWADDWIFDDPRFDLHGCPDDAFVSFLCELVHPIVRSDPDEVANLVTFFNECLVPDDWEIVEASQLSGRAVFEGRQRDALHSPATALDLDSYDRIGDPTVARNHLRRIERGLKEDPAEAISSSKELVETVCKYILDDYSIGYSPRDDVGDLYKKVAEALKLNAEAVPESTKGSKAAQKTLRTLVTTIGSLAELRNELGLGHGHSQPSPAWTRHGRLAFNAAVTVVEFLLDTWHVRPKN